MTETFQVTVDRVVFRASDSPFAVLSCATENGSPRSICGALGSFQEGDQLEVNATLENHPRFGARWKVLEATISEPDSRPARVAFLRSLKGIGAARAEQLVDLYGDDVFDRIDDAPMTVFMALDGVGEKTARKAAESWRERRQTRMLLQLFQTAKIEGPQSLAARVSSEFGMAAMDRLEADPYQLMDVPTGTFRDADLLARHFGILPTDTRRVRAGCLHLLRAAKGSEGHLYLPDAELQLRCADLLNVPVKDLDLHVALDGFRAVVEDEGRFYTRGSYRAEVTFAADVWIHANNFPVGTEIDETTLDRTRTERQRRAVANSLRRGLTLILGPPGVGKTTIVKDICEQARKRGLRVALTAPTGRAAARMSQAAGHPASTIHRLLGLRGEGSEPEHSSANVLPADVVVVDESSMLDVDLAAKLTDALKDDVRLILVGDRDQLPPPGAGDAFGDLVDARIGPQFDLDEVFRQAKRSTILRAAEQVRQGKVPQIKARDGDLADLSAEWTKDENDILQRAVHQARVVLPERLGITPDEIQVIAPMYRGGAGIDELNMALRDHANPSGTPVLGGRLRTGDRLIQTRNDYKLVSDSGEPLVNGAFCEIVGQRDGDNPGLEVICEDGSALFIPSGHVAPLKLGYAISVHKSQGSEWPATVVVLPPAPHSSFLTRRLLRTALTRGRTHCHIVGCPTTFRNAVGRADQTIRNSGIVGRLAEYREAAIQAELESEEMQALFPG